jgi:hypothetical protein
VLAASVASMTEQPEPRPVVAEQESPFRCVGYQAFRGSCNGTIGADWQPVDGPDVPCFYFRLILRNAVTHECLHGFVAHGRFVTREEALRAARILYRTRGYDLTEEIGGKRVRT